MKTTLLSILRKAGKVHKILHPNGSGRDYCIRSNDGKKDVYVKLSVFKR